MPNNDYEFSLPTCAKQVLEKAAEILADNYLRGDTYSNPDKVKEFLRYKLGGLEREAFAVMLLDNQNRLIEYNELFYGTIDAANIYPREVVKLALKTNAASVIFAHNHPSGDAEPSTQDKRVTQRLADALALVDIRVLDHFVVGETCVSFAERGLL
ncbi:TPA: DNA repair protein RadC [Vibrio parahaemolyticus]|uniref:RadC family protein n=1 Tax=Vibrio parahaemolyticus TaxID=670 RepID=UPI00248ACF8D|nr:DNA repair protein RadC [Vibrio parahaemolyticus]HBK3325494.1 DNA repair protein RadC [Vibrio parahaemolyticus]